MNEQNQKEVRLIEPDPKRWLTKERRNDLHDQISCSRMLLKQSGLLRAFLGYWVRWQASLEAEWDAEAETEKINSLQKRWEERNSLSEESFTEEELRTKLRVNPASMIWAREQWGHRLESLYLEKKHQLDKASCRLLRVSDKGLALELHHRIKAKETTFGAASREFGEGPETSSGGLLPLRALASMPLGIGPLLERMEPGKLSLPLRLGEQFCLVLLQEFKPSQFDAQIEEVLLAEQLKVWIDAVVDTLVFDLNLGKQTSDQQIP